MALALVGVGAYLGIDSLSGDEEPPAPAPRIVVREGQPGGTILLVWRKVDGEWRLVSYRSVD